MKGIGTGSQVDGWTDRRHGNERLTATPSPASLSTMLPPIE